MKFTVIVPVHNMEGQIEQCLNSIAMQGFNKSEYEVLVIVDSCTDNTEGVVRDWKIEHSDVNIEIFYAQCRTPGGARNVGLDNAIGEYIVFVDADDYLISNSAFTIIYSAIQGHNAVRIMDHVMTGNHVKFSKRLTLWLHVFSKELIGQERFTHMLLNEDYEFVKRIRSKPEYNETQIATPLYCYNYDKDKMLQRIKEVQKASRERKHQGLPSLYISDEFDVNF